MQIRPCWVVMVFLTFVSWASAMQSSNLVGTWVGKVQGYDVQTHLLLNADGSAEFEGVMGSWRVQGNRLILTEEGGGAVAYNFTLQGTTLTISGGDLMAPMVMTRLGGGGSAPVPGPQRAQPNAGYNTTMPPAERPRAASQPPSPSSRRDILRCGPSLR